MCNKNRKLLLGATLVSFSIVVFLGFVVNLGMVSNSDGSMGNCPFSVHDSMCSMGFQEHLNLWELTFSALPQKTVILLFLPFLIFLACITTCLIGHDKTFLRQRAYVKHYCYVSLFNPFKDALYKRVVNPKVF